MIYLLDTNVCVTYLRGKNPLLKSRVLSRSPADILLGSVVVAELYYGAAMSAKPSVEKSKVTTFIQQFTILPFDEAAANRVKLVTHNTAEFSRVPGLDLEDWQAP